MDRSAGGHVDRMPGSWRDSGRALSLHTYDLAMNVPGGSSTAYASAPVLTTFLLLINGGGPLVRSVLVTKSYSSMSPAKLYFLFSSPHQEEFSKLKIWKPLPVGFQIYFFCKYLFLH
ncbi:hypothetical protein Noc_0997 [Nitrosococcus oceani ATCC 19707]|uniref:Uncharacterized protein n=2 Tax=Nitrosococcus oceani TaxID=1229 RepID=Q3JCE1_NITOC|nr:hypothetical protein [Nitrosococcus oceani]ABA57505.1 hypothetical protein Noc_0997 [Nitrosococcus oceani ATCC 19707]EDZ68521.1 hypothetical protein NOC27_1848 [Nitrosococcus oceani AFC27]KFI20004.1 hypothetical protein IB75_05110 [Nitrosococcus oceani C-27]